MDPKVTSLSLLDEKCCGLAKQLSIEYVDIFEILRAELLAAETREFELIEDELLNYDIHELEYKNVDDENGKECLSTNAVALNTREGQEFAKTCVLEDGGMTLSSLLWVHGDSQDDFGVETRLCGPPYQLLDYQSPLEPQTIEEKANLASASIANYRDAQDSLSVKWEENPGQRGDGHGGVQNAELKCCDAKVAFLDDDLVVLEDAGVLFKAAKETVFVGVCDDTEKVGQDTFSNALSVEELSNTYPRDLNDASAGKRNIDSRNPNNCEDENGPLQIDSCSEGSEDENASIPFSGPISFSGVLSYSGILSQLPYSGSLSLHSDSSTSTRSFAFPIFTSDWAASPAKIGPPDSRYFRRRQRWRPSFCCTRPATLFD